MPQLKGRREADRSEWARREGCKHQGLSQFSILIPSNSLAQSSLPNTLSSVSEITARAGAILCVLSVKPFGEALPGLTQPSTKEWGYSYPPLCGGEGKELEQLEKQPMSEASVAQGALRPWHGTAPRVTTVGSLPSSAFLKRNILITLYCLFPSDS